MESSCFGALFGGLCSGLPDCMARAQVASMTVSREKAELRVGLRLDAVVPKSQLYAAEKQLCEKLRLKKCVLAPQYDHALLDGSYIAQVVEELRHRNCLVNGFLDDVSADYHGGVMNIHLKRGGLALLQSAGSDRRIKEIRRQEFGAEVEVAFDGVTELEEYSKEFTQSAEENHQKIIKIQQEKQQAVQEKKAAPAKCQTIAFDMGDLPFDRDSLAVVTGRAIKEKPVSLDSIDAESGKVVVWGDIFAVDSRESRDGAKVILAIHFTDYTSSNVMKIIAEKEKASVYEPLVKGKTVLIRGEASYDKYDGEISIRPYDICTVKKLIRQDKAPEKRVELHAHTKMSAMDAVVNAKDLVNRAYEWGHKAVAITDHGVVQSYPAAAAAVKGIRKGGGEFKVIYGVEAYFVDDINNDISSLNAKQLAKYRYHQIILVKNLVGLKNLYKLVSEAHLNDFKGKPLTLRSKLDSMREGLIIGSACEQGELYRAIVDEKPHEELIRIASYYDYLEIQPLGNNEFMVRESSYPDKKDKKTGAVIPNRFRKVTSLEVIKDFKK